MTPEDIFFIYYQMIDLWALELKSNYFSDPQFYKKVLPKKKPRI